MRVRHAIVPAYLALCLLLGGASAAGFMANMLLQLIAIAILAAAVWMRPSISEGVAAKQLFALFTMLLALFAVQLIPLPPDLWTSLPARQEIARGFGLIGQPLPWLPLSLTPLKTIASLFWLLPAVAILLGILRLGAFQPRWLSWTIIGMTVLSVGVGAMQVAGGSGSPLYFYRITNPGLSVGFFSNNNHMATLLLVTIPFLAALNAASSRRGRREARSSSGLIVLTAAILLVVVVGLAINASLAGWGLAIPGAAASFLLVRSRKKAASPWGFLVLGVLTVVALVGVLAAPLGNNLIGSGARTASDSRQISFTRTLAAAAEYFPVGSGIGSFQQVYRMRENPSEVTNVFMNHAHSDFIELALETNLPGYLIVILFLIWWARRTMAIWRTPEPDHFARAATIATALIICHSAVDYPLRTAAIAGVFAACIALMAEPRPRERGGSRSEATARHLSAN